MPAETKVMPATRLALYDVTNLEGEDLGQVENFLLDMLEGRIAFLVVAFGGILGLTDKWFAIPWEIAAWSPQDRKFVVNMPRGILEKAPGLDKRKWPQAVDLSWLTACYEHYGCAPYWERGLPRKRSSGWLILSGSRKAGLKGRIWSPISGRRKSFRSSRPGYPAGSLLWLCQCKQGSPRSQRNRTGILQGGRKGAICV